MASKGRVGFEEFYAAEWGARWDDLRGELSRAPRQVARSNAFAPPEDLDRRAEHIPRASFAGFSALLIDKNHQFTPQIGATGLLDYYLLDAASIFAAAALAPSKGDEVLDLCAAPGGKSLMLAERALSLGEGRLVANEVSDRRRARLRAVLEDYLPPEILARVHVTGHDGSRWCLHQTEAFDRVLVDAPCSGERHLISDSTEMQNWSLARSKNLAVRQYALLTSALAVVRAGGRIVYSTCSISPLENDAVISRLLKKRAGEAEVRKSPFEVGEATEHGCLILPDRSSYGPIYFSILEKV